MIMDENIDLSLSFYERVLLYTTKEERDVRGVEYVEN